MSPTTWNQIVSIKKIQRGNQWSAPLLERQGMDSREFPHVEKMADGQVNVLAHPATTCQQHSVQLTKELTCSPRKGKQSCMLRTEPEAPLVEVMTSGEFRWRKHARLASASGKITIRLACWHRPTAKKKMALIMHVETRQRHAVRRRRVVLLARWGLMGRRRSSLLFCAVAHSPRERRTFAGTPIGRCATTGPFC